MGLMVIMENTKRLFGKISNILLHALILSLSVHFYLLKEFGTVSGALLLLLVATRAIVLICFVIGIMDKNQPTERINDE